MFSGVIDTAGFAAIAYGVDVLAGRGWACVVAGICLLLIAVQVDDTKASASLLRTRTRLRRGVRKLTPRKRSAKVPASPHPPLIVDPFDEEYARLAAESVIRRGQPDRVT